MRAGRLRKKVTIERYTTARGSYGEEVETWATLLSVWASIEPMTGNEKIQGGAVDAKVTHMIKMRDTDITPADRITWSSRTFNITKVLDVSERGRELVIEAIESV